MHKKDLDLLELFKKRERTLPINVYKDDKEGYGGEASRNIKKHEIVVFYCGDVIKNIYVDKLKKNAYTMGFIDSD